MTRVLCLVVVCVLAVTAGCLGPSGGSTPATDTPRGSPTATPTTTTPPTTTPPTTTPPTTTPLLSAEAAGERAIVAEQARIERIAADDDTLTGLAFGILRPAESEVVERNRTGVMVRVRVGYSVSFDCDGDSDPESSADGAYTEATYRVTKTGTTLRSVSQEFLPSGGHC